MSDRRAHILLIDDDKNFQRSVVEGLEDAYKIGSVLSVAKAKALLAQPYSFDIVLLDLYFPGEPEPEAGLPFISYLKNHHPELPVIVVTEHENDHYLIEAMRAGAEHFFRKSTIDFFEWSKVIEEKLSVNRKKNSGGSIDSHVKAETGTRSDIRSSESASEPAEVFIGEAPRILEIKEELVALAGEPDLPVLLLGETGVGKEVAARYLHRHGPRADQPFVPLHLASVSKTLMESLLFGHLKGTFTGAVKDTDGLFQQADGGILFLDEIGEITLETQTKLLRVLQDKVIRRVGSSEDIHVNVQIISATNVDLRVAIAEKTFREDLFYRLNGYSIHIPPLRERRQDIRPIAMHYLTSAGVEEEVFSPELWIRILEYDWPGNVRELIAVLKRLLVKRKLAKIGQLGPEMFEPQASSVSSRPPKFTGLHTIDINDEPADLDRQTARRELARIEAALLKYGKKSLVVQHLGFDGLDQLRYRIVEKYYKKYPLLVKEYGEICRKYKISTE